MLLYSAAAGCALPEHLYAKAARSPAALATSCPAARDL